MYKNLLIICLFKYIVILLFEVFVVNLNYAYYVYFRGIALK